MTHWFEDIDCQQGRHCDCYYNGGECCYCDITDDWQDEDYEWEDDEDE